MFNSDTCRGAWHERVQCAAGGGPRLHGTPAGWLAGRLQQAAASAGGLAQPSSDSARLAEATSQTPSQADTTSQAASRLLGPPLHSFKGATNFWREEMITSSVGLVCCAEGRPSAARIHRSSLQEQQQQQ